jgi:signal transduction histidine kinase
MVHDITECKKDEQEIARLASFPTLNPSPVVEVDKAGEITFANPATKQLFPTLEAIGLTHMFFDDWDSVQKTFAAKGVITFAREIKIGDHWYHQQLCRVAETEQIRVYATDISELKQTEEARAIVQTKLEENATMLEEYASQMEELASQRAQQLQNAERLAAIGATAGMVGHDIRNPLQAITGDMYLIAQEVEEMPDGESKQSIVESLDSVNRNLVYINKIVSDLQDYTRPLKPNLQLANLSDLVEGTLVTIIIPKGIEVTTNIAEDAKPIKTDVAYMRRLLQNLITNAVQAMQEEGKLTIEAVKRNDKVVLSVEDTGTGIPEEVKTKMFTPLFTTKSKGQGLGLAVVRRLVDALNGTISFESTAGKGTKFMVELPQNV